MTNTVILPAELDQVVEALRSALHSQEKLSESFDLDQWLQDWLQRPQSTLGQKRPADLLGTTDGIEAVHHLLAAAISEAYQ